VKLKILSHQNVSLRIGNILKVRAILFVRMLTIFLQRKSSRISTKEACPSLWHNRSYPTKMSTAPSSKEEVSKEVAY
jgi:hypothetical protein